MISPLRASITITEAARVAGAIFETPPGGGPLAGSAFWMKDGASGVPIGRNVLNSCRFGFAATQSSANTIVQMSAADSRFIGGQFSGRIFGRASGCIRLRLRPLDQLDLVAFRRIDKRNGAPLAICVRTVRKGIALLRRLTREFLEIVHFESEMSQIRTHHDRTAF